MVRGADDAIARAAAAAATASARHPRAQLIAALQRRDEAAAFALLGSHPNAVGAAGAHESPFDTAAPSARALHVAIRLQASDALLAALVAVDPSAAAIPDVEGAMPLALLSERLSPRAEAPAIEALLRAHPAAAAAPRPGGLHHIPLQLALAAGASSGAVLALIKASPTTAATFGTARGDFPLHTACEYGASADVVRALLAAHPPATMARTLVGGNDAAASPAGYLPLHLAARHRSDAQVVAALLAANWSAATMRGPHLDLPLHLAAEYGAPANTLKALLRAYPAGLRRRDGGGRLAVELAEEVHGRKSVEYRVLAGSLATHGLPKTKARLPSPPSHSRRSPVGPRLEESHSRRSPVGRQLEDRPLPLWGTERPLQTIEGANGARCAISCGDDARLNARNDGVQPALGECIPPTIAANESSCCSLCAITLGCVGWADLRKRPGSFAEHTGCCLRSTRPNRWSAAARKGCYGVLLTRPCRYGCRFMRSRLHAHSWLGDDVNATVDVHTFPWVDVGLSARPARRASSDVPLPWAPLPSVAICLAGDARTIIHPKIWEGVWKLRGGSRHRRRRRHREAIEAEASVRPLDLFLVVGTAAERVKLGDAGHGARSAPTVPHPALLSEALAALQPVAASIVPRPDPSACGSPATAQFAKWARCVDLVRSHERRRNLLSSGRGYDFIFKGRPDVIMHLPIDLRAVAAQLQPSTILTANDVHVLAHRSRWHAMTALRPGRMRCDVRCSGRGAPVLRSLVRGFNEYCLMVATWAALGVHHLEVSHPTEPEWLISRSVDVIGADASRPAYDYGEESWAWPLYGRLGWKISRFANLRCQAVLELTVKRFAQVASKPHMSDREMAVELRSNSIWRYYTDEALAAVVCTRRRVPSVELSMRKRREGEGQPRTCTAASPEEGAAGSQNRSRGVLLVECTRCTNRLHAQTRAGSKLYGDIIADAFAPQSPDRRGHLRLLRRTTTLPKIGRSTLLPECPASIALDRRDERSILWQSPADRPEVQRQRRNMLHKIATLYYQERQPGDMKQHDACNFDAFLQAENECTSAPCTAATTMQQSYNVQHNSTCIRLLENFFSIEPAHLIPPEDFVRRRSKGFYPEDLVSNTS